jgi:hypothetical protein
VTPEHPRKITVNPLENVNRNQQQGSYTRNGAWRGNLAINSVQHAMQTQERYFVSHKLFFRAYDCGVAYAKDRVSASPNFVRGPLASQASNDDLSHTKVDKVADQYTANQPLFCQTILAVQPFFVMPQANSPSEPGLHPSRCVLHLQLDDNLVAACTRKNVAIRAQSEGSFAARTLFSAARNTH